KIQTEEQRAQVRRIAALGKSGGTLDFVAAWFLKAGEYLRTSQARIGFVATNSITQGEQVAQLWPLLFDRYGLEITFAHRTFAWGSDARGKAHVHVVIIGLSSRALEPPVKRLFSYSSVDGDPTESRHSAISPYLFDASSLGDRHLVVREESRPLGVAPKVVIGSKPIDGGHYIFERAEADAFLLDEPKAKPFMRPFVGAEEYINGGDRWILYLRDAAPEQIRGMPNVAARISAVRQKRLDSPSAGTRALADFPTRFHVTVVPDRPFLCIPKVSSERRSYVPIGWLHPPTIPSDLVFVLEDASLERFALLTSSMHMAWLRNIGGRLKSDYRYSVGLVYNPFPWPNLEGADRSRLDTLAQSVLDARTAHPGATLADLYDPDVMPADLRKAHRALDLAVDRLYRKEAFADDRERVEHLFRLYEQMTAGLLAKLEQPKRRRPTKVVAANE
ncbi:MAG: class I SAM-dependent DNA methyltransferase, partial [Phenylobacterium sp.]|nr:class I SAM-dependent DNA methyltransferase [Phenylobacterium sp.]